MTQEEKQLLLKDISARLPYKVKCSITKKGVVREMKPMNNGISMPVNQVCDITLKKTLNTDIINDLANDNIVLKPYLRPMSSMTEEEKDELYTAMDWYGEIDESGNVYTKGQEKVYRETFYEYTDWLISHHFDYRGLIPMGLALEALKGMYNSTNNV